MAESRPGHAPVASSSSFAHDANQVIGGGTAPTASHSVRIVTFGDSTTAAAKDWAPEIKEVYSDCLPAALATRRIAAAVINAGIGDTTTPDDPESHALARSFSTSRHSLNTRDCSTCKQFAALTCC
jgi:hypothetical protein